MSNQSSCNGLSGLRPINELSAPRLSLLREKAQTAKVAPNKALAASDHERWYVYLLEGKLRVTDGDGKRSAIVGGTARAQTPVFEKNQLQGAAITETGCRIIRFQRQLFDTLLSEEKLDGYEVVDVQVNESESELFEQIYTAYSKGQLELPPMPDVAMKIVKLAEDPDAGIPEIAKIVQMEPAVAGSVIKAANSPLYRGTKPVDNIKAAVVRLGLDITRNLATSIALRKTYEVKAPLIKERMRELWEHSVHISALSYVIARGLDGFDPERALMAGLLHDVGVVPILNYMEKHKLNLEARQLEDTIDKLRGMVGALVIGYWGLDAELATVVEHADDWLRDPEPKPDYCDIVLVSQLYSFFNTPRAAKLPAIQEVPAYGKLNLGALDEDMSLQILKDAEQEIAAIKQVLNG